MKLISVAKAYKQQIFVVTAFTLMAFVGCLFAIRVVSSLNSLRAGDIINNANLEIYNRFLPAENTLENILMTSESDKWIMSEPEEIQESLVIWSGRISESSVSITNYLSVYGYINGNYVDGDNWTPPFDYIPTERPWYKGAIAANEEFHYTDPYLDSMTGKPVTSVSKQVFTYDNRPIGVLAMDLDAEYIAGFVCDITIADGSYGVLLNSDMDIIVHKDEQMLGKPFDFYFPGFGIDETLGKRVTDINGESYVLNAGELFNGWYIVIVTPAASYYYNVYAITAVMFFLTAVLSCALCYILTALNNKVDKSEYENSSKSSFLARISHEIRTPMNTIAGMSELILRKDIPQDVYEHAVNIKSASDNLLSIINDILDYSKLESGSIAISASEYHFSSLMNDVVSIIRMRIQDKPVRFISNVDCEVPALLVGDEARIRQILLNVLSNAAKYTSEGYISIATMAEVDLDKKRVNLVFEIADTGTGIKEENLNKIFGDFVKTDMDSEKVIKGTGLGLAITKSLCDAMNGSIDVYSKYGEGSVFTIVIPQSFNEYSRFAKVSNPEEKKALVYEPRVKYASSLICTIDNLGVPVRLAIGEAMFYNELSQNIYKYVFVASPLYDAAMDIIRRLMLSATLIIICEPKDSVNSLRDIKTIAMPASPLTIADVFNDTTQSLAYNFGKETTIGFIAPQARVLVVDDIKTNLQVAEGLMAPYKMTVDTALSGQEAIEMLKKNVYHLVFMDHMMPEMDGIEATQKIRAIEDETGFYKKLPIVALTANAMAGMKEKFIQSGMDDFLAKPIELSKLNAVLETWIPRNMMERYVKDAEHTAAGESEFAIPGLDTKRGLAMTGGSWKNYEKTLTIYYYDAKQRIDEIKKRLEAGDIPSYTTYVHALKSASGSIGAIEVSKAAADLEEAAKGGDMAYISEHNANFLLLLEELVNAIEAAVFTGVDEENMENDIPYLHETLDRLKNALDDMDMTAIDELIARLDSGKWDKNLKNMIESISQYILLFEFDNAGEVIDEIVRKYIE